MPLPQQPDSAQQLQRYRGFIFDLDGTIYLGEELIPGADRVIDQLRRRGSRTCFLSNKPLQTRTAYAEKLTHLGIPTPPEEVINSSLVAALHLSTRHAGKCVYVVGEGPLIGELVSAGVQVTSQPREADIVLLSFDRNFHYLKLYEVLLAVRNGAEVMATNPDVTCPVPGGEIPDCGAVIAAVEACCGIRVETILGKPSQIMVDSILGLLQLDSAQVLLVGDRPATDIAMGARAGIDTCLVLSGIARRDDLLSLPVQPTYVLDSVADMLPSDLPVA